jgi:hypothetical protein
MFKSLVSAIAILSSFVALSQVSETRTVSDFSKLKSSANVKVFYKVSGENSVKVEAEDKEKLKFIKTEVENGTLKIFINSGNGKKGNWTGVRIKIANVYISGPSLNSFKASSSSEIKIENQNLANQVEIAVSSSASISGSFNCSEISIDASSSSKFKAEITANSVEVETSSSSDVILSGKTVRLKVDSSSSSTCKADRLMAEDVTATANSSADIDVYASKSLNAKASSSASIDYFGSPAQVVADKNSSGSVTKR